MFKIIKKNQMEAENILLKDPTFDDEEDYQPDNKTKYKAVLIIIMILIAIMTPGYWVGRSILNGNSTSTAFDSLIYSMVGTFIMLCGTSIFIASLAILYGLYCCLTAGCKYLCSSDSNIEYENI
jgi:ABC-type phosphate transport system permease subunit